MKNSFKHLSKWYGFAIVSSILQYLIFAFFYIMYVYYSPLTQFHLGRIFNYFAIPTLTAFFLLALVKGRKNHFSVRLEKTRLSKVKLLVRILVVLTFVIIGFWLGKSQIIPDVIMNWLNKFGEIGEFYSSLLTNFSIYLVVGIFPVVYAVGEYRVISYKNE